MTVKALFLISPAYSVPTMMTSIRSRWSRMAVPVRVPSVSGSAWNDGTQMIVKLGWNPMRSVALVRRNRLRAKTLAQAVSVHDAQPPLVVRIGPDEAILGIQVPVGAVGHQTRSKGVVVGLADRSVDLAPPDLVTARGLIDDELVLGRPSRVLAGPDDERPLGGDEALP